MGEINRFPKVKLVIGILISRETLYEPLFQRLRDEFGEIDYTSDRIPFTFTSYYDEEMGTPITRVFTSFKTLIDPLRLAPIKILSNKIEEEFAESGKRKVNVDPGIMFLSRFILASTKDGIQRVPMDSGIYGEITMLFQKKTFRPLEWTFPDYRSKEYITILNSIREIFKQQ
ncbi:MAG: DUF4416 family protein [Spirochaetales bacterium]|nr:DUF4416 family protein [Spirochaetales bacterium]